MFSIRLVPIGLLCLVGLGCDGDPARPARKAGGIPRAEAADVAPAKPAKDDYEAAERSIKQALIERPDDPSVLLLAATIASAQGRLIEAIQTASSVSRESAEWAGAQRLIAACAVKLDGKADGLEDQLWAAMEQTLVHDPGQVGVRRTLLRMLNRRGYRHRACEHTDYLCRAGLANEDELHGIIVRREAYPRLEQDELDSAGESESHNGRLAVARRWHTTHDFSNAYEALEPEQAAGWTHPEHAALFGLILAEKQAFDEMPKWLASCPENTPRYSEYWSAIGAWLIFERNFPLAAGALLQAVEIDPTSAVDYKRLGFCFSNLGAEARSDEFLERARQVGSVRAFSHLAQKDPSSLALRQRIARSLNELSRPFEFLQWQVVTSEHAEDPQGFRRRLAQQRRELLRMPDYIERSTDHSRIGLSKAEFPPPSREQLFGLEMTVAASSVFASQPHRAAVPIEIGGMSLVDVAASVGINFEYLNHSPRKLMSFRLHETLGGGIAVLDYDLDGYPDLYFGQGSGDPPQQAGERSDQLYRNRTQRFENTTAVAGVAEDGYTLGVAAGDVNQDGFADLLVGCLGENRLLVNQGDGTFADATSWLGGVQPLFTASVAIADLTGDGLPDLVETNYVDDPRIYEPRPLSANGSPTGVSPLHFDLARDRFFRNVGSGSFEVQDLETEGQPYASSLGVVVADIDSKPGNEILIANDARPNRYWRRPDSGSQLVEVASYHGLALDSTGTATASMGVAAGDFDRNGTLDFHVTNFWEQSSGLYLQNGEGLFLDLASRFGLDAPTYRMLGFGTQSFDANRDGYLDLFVLNGHIEDYSSLKHPFRMQPQFLAGSSKGFVSDAVVDPSGYWAKEALGRTLAKLDWNRDGRVDLVANHLDAPAALLENRTQTNGHWLRLGLVGTQSERDAIGARVIVRTGQGEWTEWRCAGDGYFCSNEGVLDVGLGAAATVDQLTVIWPGGNEQSFSELAVDRCYLLIEGDPTATPMPMATPATFDTRGE